MNSRLTGIMTAAALTLPLLPAMMPAASAEETSRITAINTLSDQGSSGSWDEQIENLSELEELRDMVNNGTLLTQYPDIKTYYLTADIDMSSIDNWTPIGSSRHPFTVTFDGRFGGKDHTVSGLNVQAEENYIGLFGSVHDGTIKHLNVKGNVDASNYAGLIAGETGGTSKVLNCSAEGNVIISGNYAGGIVGLAQGGTQINNCTYTGEGGITADGWAGGIVGYANDAYTVLRGCIYKGTAGKVTANHRVGGIAGAAKGELTDCINEGSSEIKAYDYYVGGIVGKYEGTEMSGCNNTGGGKITCIGSGDAAYAGGIAGSSAGKITNCNNTGSNVSSASKSIGGIAGKTDSDITGCENNGKVSGIYYVGGIVGENAGQAGKSCTVSGCTNTGAVTAAEATGATGAIGGIAGFNPASGTVTACYNKGSIAGYSKETDSIGGIVGLNWGKITGYCHNDGSIQTGVNIGGIVGKNTGTTELCYNTGEIGILWDINHVNAGGVAGSVDDSSAKLQNCYSTGDVYGDVCGGVVGISIGTVENCYSYALVAGYQSVGGVIGTNNSDNGRIISCYACDAYDSPRNIYGSTKGYIDDNSRKLTAEEFLDETNFIGWDFNDTSIWTINKALASTGANGAPDFFDMKLTDSGEKSTGYYTDADSVYHENATGFIVNFKNGKVSPEKAYVGWKVTPEGGETITFEPSEITDVNIGDGTEIVIGLIVTELEDENAELKAYALYE